MVAKGARDDYYAELLKLFLVSDTQIGKTPPSAEQPSSLAEISVPSMKFCSVCNFILKSNIDLYSIVTALIRVSLLMRKVVGISPL
jgi:hypothetical protein